MTTKPMEATKKAGRPSAYTAAKAAKICHRLAAGESLRAICRDEGMPDESTVRGWVLDDVPGFSPQYARARELQAMRWAEEVIEISDTPQLGVKTVEKATGTETTRGDMIEHRRLQVDSRKWFLSKVLPKVYGAKVDVNANVEFPGEDGTSPLELARGIAFVLSQAKRQVESNGGGEK